MSEARARLGWTDEVRGLPRAGLATLRSPRSLSQHLPQEDALLSSLVAELGAKNWTLISADLRARTGKDRNGKSCRLRCEEGEVSEEQRAARARASRTAAPPPVGLTRLTRR
jgi:hypothetical protein